ncbi:sigma-70 family RNA polymerase sigma factor [Vibrio coralliirubri]|uniref:sigma-70 family RNA polymerase sigma factor n=1 Tax=Vibrio coralliirubri TaxID=1516159 RepID=UPI002283961E|nr:sigma-70 family RNA polymerase sigma factor [Vibrio coralliirubri]MCY9860978.1 sigma-70 family RNA polymerase sigma factor [Vibrio coralliirubri]
MQQSTSKGTSKTALARSKFVKSNREIESNYKEHEKFVKATLSSVLRNFGYVITQSEREDLIQLGLMNLIELYRAFDPELGVPFHSFARKRVYGGYIDYFRSNSVIPRRQQEFYRNYQKIKAQAAANGESITLEQAASYLEIEVDKLSSMLLNWEARYSSPIDDVSDAMQVEDVNPYIILEREVDRHSLVNAITNLSEKEQIVLSLYYDKDLSLKEVADVMNLTNGRVSQIKNDAINKIRTQLA